MSCQADKTAQADLPESVFDLRHRADRARRHAAALSHDEAASRLRVFAQELDARADTLEDMPRDEPRESAGASPVAPVATIC
jgi:hypothetical protein